MNRFENPTSAKAITPSDSVDLTDPSILYIGSGGTLKVTSADNSGTVTFINVVSGTTIPLVVKRVWSGTTTCTNIIGLY
jgi:hypothetical protein